MIECGSRACLLCRSAFLPSNGSLRESAALVGLCMTRIPTVHFEAASTLAVVVSANEPLLFLDLMFTDFRCLG